MGRWSVFLTWGAMLLGVLVNAEDCPLDGKEEHAWLIRVTPMLPIADAEGEDKPEGGSGGANGTAKGGESPAPPPAKVFKFHDSDGLEQNLHYRYKRDDPTTSEAAPSATPAVGGSAAPSEQPPAEGGRAAPSEQPLAEGGRAAPSEQPPAEGGSATPSEQPPAEGGSAAPSEQPPAEGGRAVPSEQPPAEGGSAAPSEQQPAAPDQPEEATKSESGGGSLEPGVTTMHGALVTPNKVLTVLDITLDAWFSINMKKGYLSLIGYNAGKKCSQEQWGLNVQTYPELSRSFFLNAGLFLIINTHEPFAFEGVPFLFGPNGYPPVGKIDTAYHRLAKNTEGKVMMHLFKDNKTITDGSTVDVEFKFIPWKVCGKMAAVTKALDKEGTGIDAQVAPEDFFCSEGIPGIMNETMGGETEKLGFDWYRGAPVIYTKGNQTKLPIGQYVYRTGLTGDPRIYAAYNSKLSEILGGGVNALTIAPPEPEDGGDTEEVRKDKLDGMGTSRNERPRSQNGSPPNPATEGSYVIWVVMTCTFASTNHFA